MHVFPKENARILKLARFLQFPKEKCLLLESSKSRPSSKIHTKPIIDVVNRIFKTNESVVEFSQNCPEIHLIKEVKTSEASFQSVLIVLQILNRVHQF